MSVYSGVRTAIRNSAIVALSEYPTSPVIFSNSNGVEPAESYVVVNILNIEQQGHHNTSTLASQIPPTVGFGFDWNNNFGGGVPFTYELAISVCYEIQVQFSFIGSLSGDMAQSFTQRINNNPISREALRTNNLGFMRKSSIRRAPQKRDTKWVEYHNMDATFNYIVTSIEVSDIVEAVIVNSEQTGTFTIPEGVVIP